MNYTAPMADVVLLKRYKRFLADVRFDDGTELVAHCANPGAMTSCLAPECPARLSFHDNPKRKLKWSLEQTCVDNVWIVVNTAMHNRVVAEALKASAIPELAGYETVRPEVKYGDKSRIDFLLSGDKPDCYVEVKGVSLLHQDQGMFPDGVTKRGQKHLKELMNVVKQGHRGVLLFCVGRSDIRSVQPADHIDPEYGRLLRQAKANGVELLAYQTDVTAQGITLTHAVPVELPDRA